MAATWLNRLLCSRSQRGPSVTYSSMRSLAVFAKLNLSKELRRSGAR